MRSTRKVSSPVEDFPGYVYFLEPIPLPETLALRDAISGLPEKSDETTLLRHMTPAVLACIELCEIQGVDEHPRFETMPGTPWIAADALAGWMVKTVLEIYNGENRPIPTPA